VTLHIVTNQWAAADRETFTLSYNDMFYHLLPSLKVGLLVKITLGYYNENYLVKILCEDTAGGDGQDMVD